MQIMDIDNKKTLYEGNILEKYNLEVALNFYIQCDTMRLSKLHQLISSTL